MAIQLDLLNDENRGLRSLNNEEELAGEREALFKSRDGEFEEFIKIVNALEVTLQAVESDEKLEDRWTYDLLEYNEDSMYLQF